MARPRKQQHERFNLRYTLAELEFLRAEASKAALSPHEYARRRTLGARLPTSSGRADPALINELNRIGVNLNQLAHMGHLGNDVTDEVGQLVNELRRTLEYVVARDGS